MWRPGHRHASGIRRPTPLRLLPEHGPGPIGRNARLRYSTGGRSTAAIPFNVEVRDLSRYEAAYGLGGAP